MNRAGMVLRAGGVGGGLRKAMDGVRGPAPAVARIVEGLCVCGRVPDWGGVGRMRIVVPDRDPVRAGRGMEGDSDRDRGLMVRTVLRGRHPGDGGAVGAGVRDGRMGLNSLRPGVAQVRGIGTMTTLRRCVGAVWSVRVRTDRRVSGRGQ